MVPQRIEHDILIDAPVEIVWAVVTEPEHISGWFSDTVDLDLRPGGAAALSWDDYGTVHGRVERVEPPHFFSFRWVVHRNPGAPVRDGNSTLVEFGPAPRATPPGSPSSRAGSATSRGPRTRTRATSTATAAAGRTELGELQEYAEKDMRAAP